MGRLTKPALGVMATLIVSCVAPLKAPEYSQALLKAGSGVEVAVIGDTQRTGFVEVWRETNNPQREQLLRQLAEHHPDAIVHLGDMVFYGSSTADWTYFDNATKPIRDKNIPVYPLLGNHEYFGSDETMLKNVRDRFPAFRTTWYSMVIDSVAYVMLNTNVSDIGLKEMSKQHKWYRSTMSAYEHSDSVAFIVVAGHHPPFTNSTVVSDAELLQMYFVPTFMLSQKSAVWFSGHCHAYEHFYMGLKHFVVSGGGGGPRQRVLRQPHQRHIDMYEAPMVRPFHYCTVQRDGSHLNIRMHPLKTKRKTLADRFTITSSKVSR